MKTGKKILSLVLSLAMVLALVIQIPAQAALSEGGLVDAGKGKATMKLVTLETDDGSSKTDIGKYGYKVVSDINEYLSSKHAEDTFYIGVQVDGLKNIKPADSLGIFSIQFGIQFNPDIVQFAGARTLTRGENATNVQNDIKTYIGQSDGYDDYYYYMSGSYNTYNLGGNEGTNLVKLNGSEKSNALRFVTNWASTSESPTYIPEDGDLILILPFKLLVEGSGIEEGTSVFDYSTNSEHYTLSYGISNDANYYSYKVPPGKTSVYYEPSPGTKDDLLHVMTFDATGVDYFPQTYYVDFYKTESEGSAAQTLSTAKSNNPYVDQSDIDDVTKQLSPDSDGKYLKRWYYKTTEQQDGEGPTEVKKDFIGNTYAGEDKSSVSAYGTNVAGLVANDPLQGDTMRAKVYGEWEQGQSITFHSNYPEGSDKHDQDSDVTLYADPTTHKIAESELNKLESMKTPPTGYVLAGWAKDNKKDSADITDDDLATTDFSSVTDVYAVWTEMITINFYDNYNHGENDGKGHLEKSITMEPNSTIQGSSQEAPTPPSRDQYTFKEWNTKQNGSGESISSDNISSHEFSESTDLFAIWTAAGGDTVTLMFDAVIDDAKSTVKPESITVNKGDTVYKEQITDNPTVDNYTFAGWFKDPAANTDAEVKFDSGYTVNDNENLYAHWTYSGSNPAKVTFMAEGATGVGGDNKYTEVTVEKGTSLGNMMPTNPSKEGSQFKEWNENAEGGGTTFDKNTSVDGDKTVYAQWVDKITVTYDLNGGSADPPIPESSGLPGDTFNLTTTTPTKSTYDFIGWNTKQNGSGVDIEDKNDGEDWTFETLSEKAGDEFQGGKVTLYAQWGYVLGPHAGDGVTVTFDSNANGSALTEANPKEKAVEFSTSIGEGNMPNPPTRDGYTFKEWNTKQNGSGNKVDENYTFTRETDDPDSDGKMTVYAQWTVTSPDDEITISFDTNGGDVQATPPSMTIKKGDALSALPDEPTRDGYKFVKWAKGKTDADTEVKVGDPVFTTSETVYAVWTRQLRFDIGYERSDGDWNGYNQTVYNGTNQAPTHVKIYNVTNVENKEQDGTDITDTFSSYTLKYYLTTQTAVDATADAPKNAGEYRVVVEFTDNTNGETKLYQTNPGSLKVEPQGVTVKVTESTQDVKVSSSSDNAAAPTIKAEDASGGDFTNIEVKYYKWENPGNNLTSVTSVASDATDASALKVGWYVVKVTSTDPNYAIEKVTEGKTYPADGGTAALPDYAGAKMGENIYFRVILNDPKANSLKVTKPDGDELDLKDDDYTTPKPFDPEEKTDTDYYVRADKDTDAVDIEVDAGSDYDVTVEFGGQPVDKGPDGKYHIEGLEGAKEGSSNDVKVTVKPKGASEPVQEYTVHVQRLVEAKIEFKPGNSPYGLIERMSTDNEGTWDADAVAAAKADFDDNFKFDTNVPDGVVSRNIKYSALAWSDNEKSGEEAGDEDNLDKDPYAIMLYQGDKFVDPGFTAYDSKGADIPSDELEYTMSLSVRKMPTSSFLSMTDTLAPMITITNENVEPSSQDKITFEGYNESADNIFLRPGVYDLVYTIKDPVTGDNVPLSDTPRKVVVLWQYGDSDMNAAINGQDSNIMSQIILEVAKPLNGVSGNMTRGIYYFRILDVDNNEAFNGQDANILSQSILGIYTRMTFYPSMESLEAE